ncbi:MAG: EAL domain-containing protein [Alphaproteobacteria bacterium]|nr:EAL domain-containing protein [Alphaproteobacteria bacterium]
MAGRLNILLVQASESGSEAVRETLAACGCRVTEVGSGEEIAARLGQGPFDIALLNLTDGALAWCGEGASLSELVPGASIVVLLAAFDSEQAMAAIQQGAQEVLVAAELTPTRLASALECAVMRARLSHIDNLTGLPNRALLHDRLAHAIDQARRYDERLAVMFVDLDRFKAINDTLGHASGDKMLRAVAERLTDCLRGSDTVARLGGDEFVAVLDKLPRDIVAAEIAQKVIARLSEPVSTSGVEMRVTPSIGIALFPTDGEDATELIRNADAAMYQAKERGGGSYVFYRPDMNAEDLRRMGLAFALRGGLQREEFELYYQPQIELASGRIVAVEALLRWRHPQRGLVSPEHFLPLARELGLMAHIGDWAIAESCRHLRTWRRAGRPPLRLALNLSPEQFWAEHLVAQIEAFVGEAGIEADDLTLEVSEGCVMRNAAAGLTVLRALRRLGVRLAIDDYGTAHASIADLHRFPVQALKVDRRFLADVTTDTDNNAIVRAVVALAGSLDLDLVAEGAETAEQVAFLRAQNCRFAQGYVFGRPVPEDQLFDLLAEVEDRWRPGKSARPARLGVA